MKGKRQDGFIKGAGGVFACASCGQNTRATNETQGFEICPICYDVGGMENSLSDGNMTVAEFMERCKAISGFDAEKHIGQHTQQIIDAALKDEAREGQQ